MGRLSIGILGMMELYVSSMVHLLYGFYIFSTAVAWDMSQSITGRFRLSNSNNERQSNGTVPLDGSVPPIVLVHGIFGFGKGVIYMYIYVCVFDLD